MDLLVAIGVGAFTSKWRDCLLIAAAVAAVSALYTYRKLVGCEAAYIAAYLGAGFVMVIVVAAVAHGLRRLVLLGMRRSSQ